MINKITIKRKTVVTSSLRSNLLSPIIALAMTLLISSILLLFIGYSPLSIFYEFFIAPLSSLYDFAEVIMKAAILIIIALGLSVGFKANIWNIGAEGQFIIGAVVGSVIALNFGDMPAVIVIPLMMIAGGLGGALWGAIPAYLKNKFAANEILTSLMLVYIAELILSYLVYGPLKDPDGLNFPQSVYFSDNAIYPYIIEGTRLSITPIIAMILLPIIYILLHKSYLGFGIKVYGLSPMAANYAGFNAKKTVWVSFIIGGAFAGIAGISEVSSSISQLVPVISPGYGFTAIIVAFLGRLNPIGIIFAGLLIALTYIGAESAQISLGLPVSISGIFQGLLLFCLLSSDFFIKYKIEIKK